MRRKHLLTIALTLWFVPLLASSQQITWKDINGPPGFSLITQGTNGRLFGLHHLAIYYSDDDGVSWTKSSMVGGLMQGLASNGRTVAVYRLYTPTRKYELHQSTDNGVTWTRVLIDDAYMAFQYFIVSESGVIYTRLYRWSSGHIQEYLGRFNGSTWDTLGVPMPFAREPYVLRIDRQNTVYIGTSGNGLLITADLGNSWKQVLPDRYITSISFDQDGRVIVGARLETQADGSVGSYGGVFISTDTGTTWNSPGLDTKIINSVAADDSGYVFAATTDGVYRYAETSGRWMLIGDLPEAIATVFVTPANTLLASSVGTAVYRSTTAGDLWSVNTTRNRDIYSLFSPEPGTIFAGTMGDRLFRTTTGGVGWQQASVGSIPDYVYAFTKDGSTAYVGTDGGLYASTDNGDTWTNCTAPYVGGSAFDVAVDRLGRLLIGTNFGVYVSTDRAQTWQSLGLVDEVILFLACASDGALYAANESRIFSSMNNGQTWQAVVANRNDIQSLGVSVSGDVCAGVYKGVLRSTDLGDSWMELEFTTTYVNEITFRDAQSIFAATNTGVYASYDRGDHWTYVGLGSYVLSLAFDPQLNLIAGSYRGGVSQSAQPVTAVDENVKEVPATAVLYQNYPNPFNSATSFEFRLPALYPTGRRRVVDRQAGVSSFGLVSLKVYDVLGREVATLIDEIKQPGHYTVRWNASGMPSGVYFYRLRAGSFVQTRKLMLLR